MFAIRRCAVRALTQQPLRQLSTLRPITRVATPSQTTRPSLLRSFHQSRLWLAQESATDEASPAEATATDETVPTEREDKAEPDTLADQVKEFASSAAQTVSNAAASTTAAASSMASAVTRRGGNDWPGDSASESGPKRIIYIGNLHFDTTLQMLEEEMAQYGRIETSRLVTDPQGLSKGFAFLEFADAETAQRAIEGSDQKPLNGRRMAVQFHVRNERRPRNTNLNTVNPPSKTLFIGNMSYQMSDRDLNDLFREIRNVLDVRVAIDRRSGQPRGFAHADFIDVASAVKAKEVLEAKTIYGRQLRIDYSARSTESRSSESS